MMYHVAIMLGRMGNGSMGDDVHRVGVDLADLLISAPTYIFTSEPSPRARSSENSTSSAVNGVPSWNFTFLRRLKRHTVGEVCFQSVAS